MNISSRPAALLKASTLAMLVATGFSGFAQAQTVLKYAPSAEPRIMDPVVTTAAVVQQHAYLIYDTLISLDEDLKPQPQMLEGWTTSEDGKTYTMTLREGLTFHDGTPVEIADVIASINRWAQRDPHGVRLVSLGMKLEEVDARTFTVTLDKPTNLVIIGFGKMSASALFIMREEEAANTPATESVTTFIGSGPYRFVADEYRPGATMVYEKFEDYVPRDEPASYFAGGKVANIDRIEWLIMPDATTAVSALETGEIQAYESPPIDLVPVLQLNDELVVRPLGNLGQFGYLRPNFLHPPFDKVEARQALALLTDQTEVLSVAAGADPSNWQVCYSFFSCGGVNENDAGTQDLHPRNVEKAKELLAQAGYNGEPIVLLVPGDNVVLNAFASVVEPRLREGGLNIDAQYSDFSTMLSRRSNRDTTDKGGWSLFPMWNYTFEADNPIHAAYYNMSCDGNSFFGWYCSEEIEALKGEWVLATSDEERKAAASQIQEIMARDLPIIPLGKFSVPFAFSTKLEGLLDTPIPVFWNAKLSD